MRRPTACERRRVGVAHVSGAGPGHLSVIQGRGFESHVSTHRNVVGHAGRVRPTGGRRVQWLSPCDPVGPAGAPCPSRRPCSWGERCRSPSPSRSPGPPRARTEAFRAASGSCSRSSPASWRARWRGSSSRWRAVPGSSCSSPTASSVVGSRSSCGSWPPGSREPSPTGTGRPRTNATSPTRRNDERVRPPNPNRPASPTCTT